MIVNRAELNINKTEFMICGPANLLKKISNFHISFSDTINNRVAKIKILGVMVDCTLDWSNPAEKVAKTFNFKLWKLYSLKSMLSQDAKVTLIHTFVFSVLNYMSVIWLQPKHYLIYNSIVKKAGRYIFSLDIFSPISVRFTAVHNQVYSSA